MNMNKHVDYIYVYMFIFFSLHFLTSKTDFSIKGSMKPEFQKKFPHISMFMYSNLLLTEGKHVIGNEWHYSVCTDQA